MIRGALIGGFAAALVLIALPAGAQTADEHAGHHPGGDAPAASGASGMAPSAPGAPGVAGGGMGEMMGKMMASANPGAAAPVAAGPIAAEGMAGVLAIGNPFGVGQTVTQGIGFAIPLGLGLQVMKSIVENGRVVRGWLGVEARDAAYPESNGRRGAEIASVQRGSPAARAGLRPGDIVVAVNGDAIPDASALMLKAAALPPKSAGELKVLREGREMLAKVEVGERPPLRRPK